MYWNVWSEDILSISDEQLSQPDMQIGCRLGFGKLLFLFKMSAKLDKKPM